MTNTNLCLHIHTHSCFINKCLGLAIGSYNSVWQLTLLICVSVEKELVLHHLSQHADSC